MPTAESTTEATKDSIVHVTTANLNLVRTIAHHIEVARRPTEPHSAKLATKLLDHKEDVQAMLKKRVAGSIAKHSKTLPMQFVRTGAGTFFPLAVQALTATNDEAFISATQEIALLLAENHRRGLSDGLLIVGQVKVGNLPALVLIKADRQEGIQGDVAETETIVFQLLNNLFLTGGSKLHKVVVISNTGSDTEPDSFHAVLYDGSLRKQHDLLAAQYFIDDFLGARVASEGRRDTYTFYKSAQKVLETVAATPAQQFELVRALDAYMLSPNDLFTVAEFVSEVIPAELQEEVELKLREANAPDRPIVRDTIDLNRSLRNTTLRIANGIRIEVPQEVGSDTFNVSSEGGRTTIIVESPLSAEQ